MLGSLGEVVLLQGQILACGTCAPHLDLTVMPLPKKHHEKLVAGHATSRPRKVCRRGWCCLRNHGSPSTPHSPGPCSQVHTWAPWPEAHCKALQGSSGALQPRAGPRQGRRPRWDSGSAGSGWSSRSCSLSPTRSLPPFGYVATCFACPRPLCICKCSEVQERVPPGQRMHSGFAAEL